MPQTITSFLNYHAWRVLSNLAHWTNLTKCSWTKEKSNCLVLCQWWPCEWRTEWVTGNSGNTVQILKNVIYKLTSKRNVFTARNEVGARLCFYRCVWFCSQGGEYLTRYPPRPGTPPQTRYTPLGPGTPPTRDQVHPPGTRYTPPGQVTPPQDQVHPPRPGTPPLGPGTPPPGPGTPPGTRYTPPVNSNFFNSNFF